MEEKNSTEFTDHKADLMRIRGIVRSILSLMEQELLSSVNEGEMDDKATLAKIIGKSSYVTVLSDLTTLALKLGGIQMQPYAISEARLENQDMSLIQAFLKRQRDSAIKSVTI